MDNITGLSHPAWNDNKEDLLELSSALHDADKALAILMDAPSAAMTFTAEVTDLLGGLRIKCNGKVVYDTDYIVTHDQYEALEKTEYTVKAITKTLRALRAI